MDEITDPLLRERIGRALVSWCRECCRTGSVFASDGAAVQPA